MRHLLLGATVLATIAAAAMSPPIPQSPAYHLFADTRSLLGIPNCLNVVSNLPFAIVGVLGLMETFSRRSGRTGPCAVVDSKTSDTEDSRVFGGAYRRYVA